MHATVVQTYVSTKY